MPKLNVFDRKGKKVGTYNVEPTDFAPRICKQLLHDAVVMYQANWRQGSHRTKSRSDASGSNRKLYRQKGTGNARMGHRRSGIRRGGGHIFARRPRDYSYHLPRKALQLATCMALASKVEDDQIIVIDDLHFDEPRTRDMATILRNIGCENGSLMITTAQYDQNVYKSARNLDRVSVLPAGELNALSILSSRLMLITKPALDALKQSAAAKKRATQGDSKR
jgi:large subunit ribosomal protein L4